jgi:GDP-L-fucose synthase
VTAPAFWKGKKVVVTGGAGFIGSHVVEALLSRGAQVRVADNLSSGGLDNLSHVRKDVELVKCDLLTLDGALKACRSQDVVLNLAAHVGGVQYNTAHQATMFRDNMLIGTHMLEAARRREVERFLVVSTACVYPKMCSIPTPESEGFKDWPEDSNEGYGWAKRMHEFAASMFHKEFGMKIAIARPYNAYGPRDHFDPQVSHVIAALIRRIVGGEDPVEVWGDGSQTRAFLYVEDFARGLLEVCEKYPSCDPVNLGTDEEVTIRHLAGTILRLSGSKAKLKFDASKPSGQPRRNCDTRKAREKVGFEAKIGLEEGLRRTIEWYKKNQ